MLVDYFYNTFGKFKDEYVYTCACMRTCLSAYTYAAVAIVNHIRDNFSVHSLYNYVRIATCV